MLKTLYYHHIPISRLLQGIMLILIFHFRVGLLPFETTDNTTGLPLPRPMSTKTKIKKN